MSLATDPPPDPRAPPTARPLPDTPPARILVVDDNEAFREMLCLVLKNVGYEVHSVADGKDVATFLRHTPVDLVITDLIMPEKEGIETIIELRRTHREIKIIAVSGGGRLGPEDYLPIAAHAGAAATLSKPFTSEEILSTVWRVLHPG
jgi:CheY-like chemotaxis protein